MELPDLYAAVPAAEEEDLLEEVARERSEQQVQRLLGEGDDPETPPQVPDEPVAEPGYPLPQVLGLLEHRLGAQVLPPEPPPAP